MASRFGRFAKHVVFGINSKTDMTQPSILRTPTLLPCPFCGAPEEYSRTGRMKGPTIGASQEMDEDDEYIEEGRTWGVCCATCGSSTGSLDSEPEAIAAWNRRAPMAA